VGKNAKLEIFGEVMHDEMLFHISSDIQSLQIAAKFDRETMS
jgi:hypothetical protein